MLENYTIYVSYIVVVVFYSFVGGYVTQAFMEGIVKHTIRETRANKLVAIFFGSLVYVLFALSGAVVIQDLLLKSGIINRGNVDVVAIVGFVLLVIVLEKKYGLTEDATEVEIKFPKGKF